MRKNPQTSSCGLNEREKKLYDNIKIIILNERDISLTQEIILRRVKILISTFFDAELLKFLL
jgi:hypothetical protein